MMVRDWRDSTRALSRRIAKIEKFLDDNYNYFWMIGEQQIKENPPPVKEEGQIIGLCTTGLCDERNLSLRNLAARENQHICDDPRFCCCT